MTQPPVQREGFEVMAELVRQAWSQAARHAGTAIADGPDALLPAISVPQAQIDLQRAIQRAFHAGMTFQAGLRIPSLIMIDDPGPAARGED